MEPNDDGCGPFPLRRDRRTADSTLADDVNSRGVLLDRRLDLIDRLLRGDREAERIVGRSRVADAPSAASNTSSASSQPSGVEKVFTPVFDSCPGRRGLARLRVDPQNIDLGGA